MDLKIFDVAHGACALLECDDQSRVMVDCGHNGDTGWRPGNYLRQRGISTLEMLTVTNYDEDHVSGLVDLDTNVDIKHLLRNRGVETKHLKHLKSETGMGQGIKHLCHMIDDRFTATSTSLPAFTGLTWSVFAHRYPTFLDENNLSLVWFARCHDVGVLFPGDLEKEGWLKMLEQKQFCEALGKTRVLIASHHGREGGCCADAMGLCTNLNYIVISDKGYQHDTQQTVPFYAKHAKGGPFRGETRKVLTTRKDGRIGFTFRADGWSAY